MLLEAGNAFRQLLTRALSFLNSKIRCCNFLFVNAVQASHSHCELTEQEAAFRISN